MVTQMTRKRPAQLAQFELLVLLATGQSSSPAVLISCTWLRINPAEALKEA
jgi:hypothetical protein